MATIVPGVACPKCYSPMSPCGSDSGKKRYKCLNPECGIKTVTPKRLKDNSETNSDKTIEDSFWEYKDKNEREDVHWKSFVNIAEQHQDARSKLSTSQETAEIEFTCNSKYFAVMFSSDWHLGSVATDYTAFRDSHDFLLQADNLYMVTCGDLIDNFRKFRSLQAIFSQVLSPNEQGEMLRSLVIEYADKKKWLAACWGNHDIEWDENNFGDSWQKRLLGQHFVYFNGKGFIKIKVKNTDLEYGIGLSHYFNGKSIHNPTHSLVRAYKDDYGAANPDVIVQGDKHNYSYQWFQQYDSALNGHPCHYIQVGTFKVDDGYSKRFWGAGQIGLPTVVFNTETHETDWFQTPEKAVQFMED